MQLLLATSLCLAVIVQPSSAGMTMDQVRQAMKMMRNVCQPKSKVTPELVDGLQKGDFPDDRNLKCYIKCVMQMMQTMKGGKLKTEAAIAQAKMMLPEEVRDKVLAAMDNCKNSADGLTDPCDIAYTATKCIYDTDPQAFVFP